ncbi:uncharacterized protein LOC134820204 [Bolinopsis microptera]|uniref:uncharacterized protein LOC134820204 n=1 Tax=Bolinopsis microptera TaxID=2820187 RepID=UPI00307AA09E
MAYKITIVCVFNMNICIDRISAGDCKSKGCCIQLYPDTIRFKLSGKKTSLSSESPTTDIFLVEGDFSLVQVTLDDRAGGDLNIIKTSSHFHLSLLNWNTQAVHSLTFLCPTSGQEEVYEVLITPSEPDLTPPPIKLEFSELISTLLPTVVLGLLVLLIVIGIVFLTTASYRRLKSTSSQWDSPLTMNSMLTTPVKIGSPFRPASVTVTPTRLKTPLYTKPRGTPGSI